MDLSQESLTSLTRSLSPRRGVMFLGQDEDEEEGDGYEGDGYEGDGYFNTSSLGWSWSGGGECDGDGIVEPPGIQRAVSK